MAKATHTHVREADVVFLDPESEGALRSAVGAASMFSQKATQRLLDLPDAALGRLMKNGLSQISGLVVQVQFGRSRAAVDIKAFEARAEQSRKELVESRDILSSDQFINALGLTRQALSKAVLAKRMFTINVGTKVFYPAFYTWPDIDRKKVEEITKLLGDLPGWTKWQFFTTAKGSLDKATPLEALKRGKFEEVKKAAAAFAER
ncbi:hypothetical protein [Cupriavidus sp. a3]|uniref:hypothetical protein n=1 Tax=Cupriavidus sp. a3 TaxID=3242158 RepID=UPI003D9C40BA